MNKENSTYLIGESYLAYREKKEVENIDIRNSADVYRFLMNIWHDDLQVIERFLTINLNRAHKIISYHWVSQGGVSGTLIDTKILFKSAIESLATSIIIAHNHPSGRCSPSEADINITKKIKEGCEILDIKLLDHLVVTSERYNSMADEGLI